MAKVQVGKDEVVFARKVPVEGHLGHAGVGDDAVDPGSTKAFGVEEVMRSAQDPLSGGQVADVEASALAHDLTIDRLVYIRHNSHVDRSVYMSQVSGPS
ncbi:hypothetical protein FQZ97_1176660 [compost metagenome]